MTDGERKEWPWMERAATVCATLADLIEDPNDEWHKGVSWGLASILLLDLDSGYFTLNPGGDQNQDDDLVAEFMHRRKPIDLSDVEVDDEGCGYIQATAGGDENRAAELLALAAVRGMARAVYAVRPEHTLMLLHMEMSRDLWLNQAEWNEVEAMVKAIRAVLDARYTKRGKVGK